MKRNERAFTIMELIIGLSITVLIGLTVAGVTAALSNAYGSTEGFFERLQIARTTVGNVQEMIRKAKLVTAITNNIAVLWAGDTNGDGQINHSEIAVLKYFPSPGKLKEFRVQYPAEMSEDTREALDTTEPLSGLTNARKVYRRLRRDPYVVKTTLATDLLSWSLTATPQPPLTTLVSVEVNVGNARSSFVLRSACALRGDATGQVGTSDGKYVLIQPGDEEDDGNAGTASSDDNNGADASSDDVPPPTPPAESGPPHRRGGRGGRGGGRRRSFTPYRP